MVGDELRTLLDVAPDAMAIVDDQGAISLVNAQTEKLFGYSREELVGKPVEMLIPARYRETHARHRHAYNESPRLRPMGAGQELYGLRKDGREFPVEISLSPIGGERGILVFAAIRDVTDRKLAEAALRRSEAYLAEAQELTRTGSWAWDPRNDEMLYCSEEIFRIYELDRQAGMPSFETLLQRIHPDDSKRVRESTAEGVRQKAERRLEYRIVLPDGTVKFIESIRRPMSDAAGNVVEVVGTSIDVTERRRIEEERERLRELEAELAHVNRVSMLGELATSLAHEIKQPIAAAVTNAHACIQWLARDSPDLDEARAAARRIEGVAVRASEIIDRMRSFYRKDAPGQREPVDVNEVIREMTVLMRNEAVRRSRSFIRLELADPLPAVIADRVQLQQILMNLTLNAIEAMTGASGEVTIKSEPSADGEVLISIADTGVGLPAEGAARIFDPFFTTKPHGTGMGLAITRSLVESHGGRLWATSNVGKGATFSLTLPAAGPLA